MWAFNIYVLLAFAKTVGFCFVMPQALSACGKLYPKLGLREHKYQPVLLHQKTTLITSVSTDELIFVEFVGKLKLLDIYIVGLTHLRLAGFMCFTSSHLPPKALDSTYSGRGIYVAA
jgi:hypothetical protein